MFPWANTFGNFEILDRTANRSSGSTLRQNIERERNEQAAYYNDPQWRTTYDLIFDRVEADGGGTPATARWLDFEVSDGEHIDVLERLIRGPRQ